MVFITEELIRKNAEHHAGGLATLKELALHQQGIEKIQVLNQLCRHLTCLYLHSNIIQKIENLHRLKDLQQLNLALNNIQVIEGLNRCESLRKLDLTLNFISLAALPTVASLLPCYDLRELHLLGNPCTKWEHYRKFVIASLPQLQILDGEEISAKERQSAVTQLPVLHKKLELSRKSASCQSHQEDYGKTKVSKEMHEDVNFTTGAAVVEKQPWCPQTRIQDQRESERKQKELLASQAATNFRSLETSSSSPWRQRPLRKDFPEIPIGNEEDQIIQCNEGEWEFSLEEEERKEVNGTGNGSMRKMKSVLVLTINLENHLDIRAVQLDIQPTYVRMLARGRLFQVRLPAEVNCDAAVAQRSLASGKLILTLPAAEEKEVGRSLFVALNRQTTSNSNTRNDKNGTEKANTFGCTRLQRFFPTPLPCAAAVVNEDDDNEGTDNGLPQLPG